MDDDTTPIEAGFAPMIKLKNRENFIAEDILKDPSSVRKILTPIILEGRRAARHGDLVLSKDEKEIGIVTSGMFSPLLEKAIALAYINSENKLEIDDDVMLKVGTKALPGVVVSFPFYKEGTVRKKI